MSGSRLHQLPVATRRALALLLAAAAIGYFTVLAMAYLHLTSPSVLFPELRELDRLLFTVEKPVSRIERLLEAGTGDIDSGGTMRPAFTELSTGWEALTQPMTADELADLTAEREGERLALLDWVRSGANREAYEQDDYALANLSGVTQISPQYVLPDDRPARQNGPARVRIRTLITDRCVVCHGENGRHDTARFISLDSHEQIEPRTRPEAIQSPGRTWLLAALLALPPLALFVGPVFWRTQHSRGARIALTALPSFAIGAGVACCVFGQEGADFSHAILSFALAAAIGILIQIAAILSELSQSDPRVK